MFMFKLLSLSSVAMASAASNVTLTVESNDNAINGSYVQNVHFGAGLNGALVSNSPVTYDFNISDATVFEMISYSDSSFPYVMGETLGQLTFVPGSAEIPVKIDCNGYLTVNGSSSAIYACDSLKYDPYRLVSSSDKGFAIYGSASEAPSDCSAVKIKVTNTH